MSTAATAEVPCPACDSIASKRLFEVRDYANPSYEEVFGVRRCAGCGAGFLSPRPLEANLGRHYEDAFYWSFEGGKRLSPEQLLHARAPQLRAKEVLLRDMTPGRLLDVGAMKGESVHVMRKQGWDAEGIEYSSLPENMFSVPIRQGDLMNEQYEDQSFDCVTFWAVLEHVYRPADYVRRAMQLLRPGGRLILVVTNFNSLQGRVLRMDDFPRHLTLFTAASLGGLLRRHGFEIARMFTAQDIFGSSAYGALVTLAKRAGGYSMSEILYERRSQDPHAFCCHWRGSSSAPLLWLSRVDRAVSLPIEWMLDRLGLGHTLTCVAHRPSGT
jgi:SAM-dependent methyltransferase